MSEANFEFEISWTDAEKAALAEHHRVFQGAVAALTYQKLKHRSWAVEPQPGDDITIPKGQGGILVKFKHGEETRRCWVIILCDEVQLEFGKPNAQEKQILTAAKKAILELVADFRERGVAALAAYEPYRQKTGLGADPLTRFFSGISLK